jgi:STE24 endopeptidase
MHMLGNLALIGLLAAGTPSTLGADAHLSQVTALTSQSGVTFDAPLDPVAATEAYLATIPADRRALGAAYFEGSYWIGAWTTLLTAGLMLALLELGWSRRLRDRIERGGRRRSLAAFAYFVAFLAITSIVLLPWRVYTGFIRESRYGLMNQPVGSWLIDRLGDFGVDGLIGGFAVVGFYTIVRLSPRRWPVWGGIAGVLFTAFLTVVYPVYIAPISSSASPLTDGRVRAPLLAMARANGVEVGEIFVIDESSRSDRVNAQVSGFLGTERITLNDNLLNRTSLAEIKTAMAHELGHLVLNHVYEGLLRSVILLPAAFFLMQYLFNRAVRIRGGRWGVRDIEDLAGLPLLFLLFTLLTFGAVPLTNTLNRIDEAEADTFALNVAREPDGAARLALTSSEFRKVDPTILEEVLFYARPSPRTRIYRAMVWKAEQARVDAGSAAQGGARVDGAREIPGSR